MDEVRESWGRQVKASRWAATGSLFMVVVISLWLFWNWIALDFFDGSYLLETAALHRDGIWCFCSQYLPHPSWDASLGYIAWLFF